MMEDTKRKADRMVGSSLDEATQAGSLTSQDAKVAAWIVNLHRELLAGPFKEINGKKLTDNAADMAEAENLFRFYVNHILFIPGKTPMQLLQEDPDTLKKLLDKPGYVKAMEKFVNNVVEVALAGNLWEVFEENKASTVTDGAWTMSKFDNRRDWYNIVSLFMEKHYFSGLRNLYPQLRHRVDLSSEEWTHLVREEDVAGWEAKFASHGAVKGVLSRMLRPSLTQKSGDSLNAPVYANVLPIIQASGSGKSRLLKELVRTIPGVYVSLSQITGTLPACDFPLVAWLRSVAKDEMPSTA